MKLLCWLGFHRKALVAYDQHEFAPAVTVAKIAVCIRCDKRNWGPTYWRGTRIKQSSLARLFMRLALVVDGAYSSRKAIFQ